MPKPVWTHHRVTAVPNPDPIGFLQAKLACAAEHHRGHVDSLLIAWGRDEWLGEGESEEDVPGLEERDFAPFTTGAVDSCLPDLETRYWKELELALGVPGAVARLPDECEIARLNKVYRTPDIMDEARRLYSYAGTGAAERWLSRLLDQPAGKTRVMAVYVDAFALFAGADAGQILLHVLSKPSFFHPETVAVAGVRTRQTPLPYDFGAVLQTAFHTLYRSARPEAYKILPTLLLHLPHEAAAEKVVQLLSVETNSRGPIGSAVVTWLSQSDAPDPSRRKVYRASRGDKAGFTHPDALLIWSLGYSCTAPDLDECVRGLVEAFQGEDALRASASVRALGVLSDRFGASLWTRVRRVTKSGRLVDEIVAEVAKC